MYPSTSRSTTSTALTTWCVAAMYNSIGSLTLGAAKIGLVARMAFISSNPAVAASVHEVFGAPEEAIEGQCLFSQMGDEAA